MCAYCCLACKVTAAGRKSLPFQSLVKVGAGLFPAPEAQLGCTRGARGRALCICAARCSVCCKARAVTVHLGCACVSPGTRAARKDGRGTFYLVFLISLLTRFSPCLAHLVSSLCRAFWVAVQSLQADVAFLQVAAVTFHPGASLLAALLLWDANVGTL